MSVFDVVCKRRSIRKFKPDAVEDEKVNMVLEAARMGPSAANRQPCHFVVVTDSLARSRLREAYDHEWFLRAPVIVVVCVSPADAWRKSIFEEYWKVDGAIAMQNLVLVATELGLGTCWIAAFDENGARRALGVPKGIRVVAMTPLGYPDEEKGPATDRKPLGQIVHRDKW